MICYSLLDSEVIGKRYLKFPFDVRCTRITLQIEDWQKKPRKTASLQAYLAD